MPKLEVITQSRMQCFLDCPKKHEFAYQWLWRPQGTPKSLRMGTAVHTALDAIASGDDWRDMVADYYSLFDDIDDIQYEEQTVVEMVRGYISRWRDDRAEVIESEVQFEIMVRNPDTNWSLHNVRLAGKIDKIIRLPDGRVGIREHKTCGESIDPSSGYWDRLDLDPQVTIYMIAARECGFDIDFIEYDVIRKPALRVRKVDGEPEPLASFASRIATDIASRPEWYYQRRPVPRTTGDIERQQRELVKLCRFIADAKKNGVNWRNPGACRSRGTCPYIQICREEHDPRSVPDGFRISDVMHEELA